MNLYLCHDLWINVVVYFLIWPHVDRNGGSMSFNVGITLILVLTEVLAALNFIALGLLFKKLFPKKKKKTSSYDTFLANSETSSQ